MSARAAFVVLVTSSLFASAIHAEEEEEFPVDPTLTGPYIGASMGVGWENFDSSIRGPGEFGPSAVSSLILGYRGGQYVSLESEFELLSGFKSGQEEIDGWMTSLGFRVHVPVGKVEPYLTYGGGVLHFEGRGATLGTIDETDFAMFGGGGIAYQWSDYLSLFAEGIYTWPISDLDGFDHGTLRFGLIYKFIEEY
jgi:opacity protein-like surface antigen